MMPVELEALIDHVQALKAETQTLELKAAAPASTPEKAV